jgi:hypothetical protein
MSETWRPVRFIDAEIEVAHDRPPALSKKPPAPDSFVWRERTYRVLDVLSTWTSYERRGRMADNMAPAHLATAARRGSWGVGRFYFRVRTEGGSVFDLYYDREPESAGDRAGHWFLWRELAAGGPSGGSAL